MSVGRGHRALDLLAVTSVLSIDFETASEAKLPKIGAYAYARHPSTRILCMAWAFDDEPVSVWRPDEDFPERIYDHVLSDYVVRGWNVAFEYAIWDAFFPQFMPIDLHPGQLDDTMARAAYWGLPLALDQAGAALGLSTLKDKTGHALMLRMSRPRSPGHWWHEEDPQKYDELCAYCAQDVEAERAIAHKLHPLPDREKRIWQMDFEINQLGVAVDTVLVQRLKEIAAEASQDLNARLTRITGGLVTTVNATGAMLKFIHAQGFQIPDLQKTTVAEALHWGGLSPVVTDVLQIRQAAAKTSTAKLAVLTDAVVYGRVCGMTQYYGAARTGRWAGRLLQPQNLPRGTIKDIDGAIDMILNGATVDDLESLFPVGALDIVSSLLRSCLVAGPGKSLIVADFSQIEARVIAWLAGQEDVVEVFKAGNEDIYVYTARRIGSTSRQLGKVLVLACGFGMGPGRFQETAADYGIDLTAKQAEDAVAAWRDANPDIVQFWWACDRAARAVAAGSKVVYLVGPVTFRRRQNSMVITLPSGRELIYRNVRLVTNEGHEGRDTVVYDGVHQITKNWSAIRTYGGKLAENITQAVARDVMADAMLDMDLPIVLTVHDEIIVESHGPYDAAEIMQIFMSKTPAWAPGLPVAASGWTGPRYKKG